MKNVPRMLVSSLPPTLLFATTEKKKKLVLNSVVSFLLIRMYCKWTDHCVLKISNLKRVFSLSVQGKAATIPSSDSWSSILASWQQDRWTEGFTYGLKLRQRSISCCFSSSKNTQSRVVTHNPMFSTLLLFAMYMFWTGNLLPRVTVKCSLVATVHLMWVYTKPAYTISSSFFPHM